MNPNITERLKFFQQMKNKMNNDFLQNLNLDMFEEKKITMTFDYDLKNLDTLTAEYKRKNKTWKEEDILYIIKRFTKLMIQLENNFCTFHEISLRMLKIFPEIDSENKVSFNLRVLNPFLQTKYFMKYLNEFLESFENGPSGAKNNLFLFDFQTRRNFLKQKKDDREY